MNTAPKGTAHGVWVLKKRQVKEIRDKIVLHHRDSVALRQFKRAYPRDSIAPQRDSVALYRDNAALIRDKVALRRDKIARDSSEPLVAKGLQALTPA